MNIEEFRDYCLSFPGVTEGLPFGDDTLVAKVMGKIFAITGVDDFEFINLKCDPDRAVILREQHEEIKPGWHMNKAHWNSGYPDGMLDDEMIQELITHSYELIVESLTKKKKEELKALK